MKNLDCYKILEGLKDIKQIPYSELSGLPSEAKMKYLFHTDFIIACARNKKQVEDHLQILEEIKKPTDLFNKYQEKRREIAKEFAKKDENKNPIIVSRPFGNGQVLESYVIENINDKTTPYNKEIITLEKENEKLIKDQTAKDEQFGKALEEECDLKLFTIRESIIPMGLSLIAAEAILTMISEDTDKPNKPNKELKKTAKQN